MAVSIKQTNQQILFITYQAYYKYIRRENYREMTVNYFYGMYNGQN